MSRNDGSENAMDRSEKCKGVEIPFPSSRGTRSSRSTGHPHEQSSLTKLQSPKNFPFKPECIRDQYSDGATHKSNEKIENKKGINFFFFLFKLIDCLEKLGGGQILERRNVERPIFRNFKIANIKITKDKLFDSSDFEFNFIF